MAAVPVVTVNCCASYHLLFRHPMLKTRSQAGHFCFPHQWFSSAPCPAPAFLECGARCRAVALEVAFTIVTLYG